MQPRLNTLGCCSRIRLRTLFLRPTITLAESDAKPITFSQGMKRFSRTADRASNRVWPVAMLHTGQSRNRSTASLRRTSHSLTITPKYFLRKLSFSPSHKMVNGCVWQADTTASSALGPSACVISAVVFVLAQANDPAILLSGNITLQSFVKWSAVAKERLCSATNLAKNSSDLMVFSFRESVEALAIIAEMLGCARTPSSKRLCFAVSQCRLTSWTPPPAIAKSTPQTVQKANEGPFLLALNRNLFHSG